MDTSIIRSQQGGSFITFRKMESSSKKGGIFLLNGGNQGLLEPAVSKTKGIASRELSSRDGAGMSEESAIKKERFFLLQGEKKAIVRKSLSKTEMIAHKELGLKDGGSVSRGMSAGMGGITRDFSSGKGAG